MLDVESTGDHGFTSVVLDVVQELEENEEYVEAEDEFDIKTKQQEAAANPPASERAADDEEAYVEVLKREDIATFSSDDENDDGRQAQGQDEQPLHYLPAVSYGNSCPTYGAWQQAAAVYSLYLLLRRWWLLWLHSCKSTASVLTSRR